MKILPLVNLVREARTRSRKRTARSPILHVPVHVRQFVDLPGSPASETHQDILAWLTLDLSYKVHLARVHFKLEIPR